MSVHWCCPVSGHLRGAGRSCSSSFLVCGIPHDGTCSIRLEGIIVQYKKHVSTPSTLKEKARCRAC
eukprot:6172210-Pleurochrysis_carterae.AAC.2